MNSTPWPDPKRAFTPRTAEEIDLVRSQIAGLEGELRCKAAEVSALEGRLRERKQYLANLERRR